ncbi:hypothetical protein BDV10DRAFT_191463 [Aspergillus recurvatus]
MAVSWQSNLDQTESSANSARSPPPPHSTNPSGIRDSSLLSAPLQSPFPSPGASSHSAAGSPGRPTSPGNRSVAFTEPSTRPVLPRYRDTLDSSTTSPEDKKAESSVYYTTAWGSPYAAPSPRTLSWSLSQKDARLDRDSGDSSPISIQFGLEPNRPNILRRLHPSQGPVIEVGDSNSEHSPERRRGKSIQDFTQDWINQYLSGQQRTERSNWLSDDSGSEAPSFITAANHFADDASDDWLALEQDSRDQDLLKTPTLADFVNRRSAAKGGPIRKIKESLHKRTDTLRQEDFWGFAYDKDPQPNAMADTKEAQPAGAEHKSLSPDEKPLPPPPVDEKERTPIPTMETPGDTAQADVDGNKPAQDKPLPRRQRKKIPWRGKGCVIDLPLYDKRGTEESGYRLLTAEDVRRGLQQWEELGYDVRGFNLGGASRPSYPEESDIQDKQKSGSYTVSFPNKALWDEYVSQLQEEKLRALGVFGGDDEVQPTPSPASALNPMTPFPGLVASPPIPTASAASNPLSGGSMSNGIASLASPASQFGVQTPFYGPTPPAQGSLTPQSFINLRQSGPTSTIPGTLSSLTSMLSPVSPMNDPNAFHPGFGDHTGQQKEAFDDQYQHQAQDDYAEDQLRPLRTPPPNPDNFHASTVEIAQPTPRGHSRGHNLSETLQRGIDQVTPDYHLEDSIDRELDDGDYDLMHHNLGGPGLLNSRWALPETNAPQHMPQHLNHFYGDAYSGEPAHEGSDIDTNPSLSGTPRRNGSLAHHSSFVGGHRSKLSTSSLNVEAKEFAPTGQLSSQQLPLKQQTAFQFPNLEHSMFTFGAEQPAGRLNVAAPSQSSQSREFKFSAPSTASTKIFDDIDISNIANSAKKSKAIPILSKGPKETMDDRGRPVPTDRHKRARRAGGGDDGEARFSTSHPLGEANNSQPQQPSSASQPAEGKENALPEQDTKAPVAHNDPVERKDTPASQASTWAPSDAKADAVGPNEIQHKGPEAAAEDKPEHEGPKPVEYGQKSALSASAKPFSFKPSIAEFDTPPKQNNASPPAQQLFTELSKIEDQPQDIPHKAEENQTHIEDDQDSPDEEQLNAIMDQLNEDSDIGVERISTPKPISHLPEPVQGPSKEKRHVQADNRSEPPSPSPGRGAVSHTLSVPKLDFDAQSQFSATPTKGVASNVHSPVRQLLSRNDHISDWDDVISPKEDIKLANRSRFFDRRINELLGSAIDERLYPLENALGAIQDSLAALASTPAQNPLTLRSTSAEMMDSDADDEDEEDYQEDAPYTARSPIRRREHKLERLKNPAPAPEQPAMEEIVQLRNTDPTAGLREMIQEVVAAQINSRSRSDAEEIGADSLMIQINSLKDMLRGADERTDTEYKKRRQAQDTIAQLQRLLKDVEEEAARHSAAAESAEARLLQFQQEKMPYYEGFQQKAAMLEKERESTRLTLDELSSKNISLQGTLDEYRFMADSAKRETEEANARLEEVKAENHQLHNTVANMKNLSGKMDQLQDQLAALTGEIARDQASWRRKEEELKAKYSELWASHNRETKLQQEREAAKLKFIFGQSQQENERLEDLISELRQKNQELDTKASRFEREFNEARESSRMEIEAATTQVNITQLDNAKLDSDTARERYEMLLEEAHETKATAVASAIESKEYSMEEQRKLHERVLNDLREHRQRTENHYIERLQFSDDKIKHLQERSAARAAAEAAQSAKSAGPTAPSHSSSPSLPINAGLSVPEKISPQALRESILVLQDQLQQRETRIDELEAELSAERDSEITWLRELLGVRLDDLQDIINTLSQPSFNKDSVRDAAIRLKANLQMQQQEKERAMNGQSFPSLPSLAELTASPRALPLAAAAAWGSWRKGRENANPEQTPSKPSPATSFLSGLLTPPSSNVRQGGPNSTAAAGPSWRRPSETRPLKSVDTTRPLSSRAAGRMLEPPTTPPLLRGSSYDHDAEPTDYTGAESPAESPAQSPLDEDGSTADGFVSASPKEIADGPFGPQIA